MLARKFYMCSDEVKTALFQPICVCFLTREDTPLSMCIFYVCLFIVCVFYIWTLSLSIMIIIQEVWQSDNYTGPSPTN